MLDLQKFKGKKLTCVGLGEVLFDVFEDSAKLGGAPANFAFHSKMQGLDSIVVSAVGKDEYGSRALLEFALNKLPTMMPQIDFKTGAVNVKLDGNGIPSYTFLENTAYDNIPFGHYQKELAKITNIACFGSLAQRGELSQKSILAFLDTMPESLRLRIFDINLRANYYNKDTILNSLKRTEIFKCNEEELPVICKILDLENLSEDRFFEYLNSQNIYGFIFTKGSESSTVFINDEKSTIKTPKVKVVDTVGAGDSFTATVVASLVKGMDLHDAHQKAVDVAAFVCTCQGAMPVYDADMLS